MGKACRWFRTLLHLKKPHPKTHSLSHQNDTRVDPTNQAIAVAAATSAVAEAAVAAAHAAAEVVRLTSSGRRGNNTRAYVSGRGVGHDHMHFAAVKIQAVFRGYLARQALRGLKSVVRLQALIRGHLQRTRTADWLCRLHNSVLRAQTRAHGGRVQTSERSHSSAKSSQFQQPDPATPEKIEHSIRAKTGKYEPSAVLQRAGFNFNGGECDKILQIDSGKPRKTPKPRNLLRSYQNLSSDLCCQRFTASKDSGTHQTVPSLSSGQVQFSSPLKFSFEEDEAFCTADNSPQFYSASSRGGGGTRSPLDSTASDGSRSFLGGVSDYPNYMSNTESSKAKVRSVSEPKQRPQYERSTSTKRHSIHVCGGEARSSSAQRPSALRVNFAGKAYPGSGRLDELGMPMCQRL